MGSKDALFVTDDESDNRTDAASSGLMSASWVVALDMDRGREKTHLALVGDETAVESVEALVAVVGLRVRGSWRRFEIPASLVPVNEELDLPYLELLEKLCFMELEVDLNIFDTPSSSRSLGFLICVFFYI